MDIVYELAEADSVRMDLLANEIMRSYRLGIDLVDDDKQLTAFMINEYFDNASYLWIMANIEAEEVDYICSLAENLIPN